MISSSRSTLYRFLSLYAALYAGFGVQSPYLPILLDNRHLSPETIALALAAGTAMRLMAAPAVARLADRFDAPRAILALCSAAAGLIGLGYLPAQGAWVLIALGVVHTAALAPLPPLSDTLALGAAAPTGSGGMPRWKFHYGWLRGCGSAAFVVGLVMSGQAIGHFGIVVIVWLNTALLLAASPVALGSPFVDGSFSTAPREKVRPHPPARNYSSPFGASRVTDSPASSRAATAAPSHAARAARTSGSRGPNVWPAVRIAGAGELPGVVADPAPHAHAAGFRGTGS